MVPLVLQLQFVCKKQFHVAKSLEKGHNLQILDGQQMVA